ncbi:integral membrane [Lecanosticta acicola]|uniref:Integral membrane n=1 Tax=Lecanosticta acicola TaxID=111012 RepID=A0AAI9E8Z5_9PEZI|nr:integral membrane [Lecanosticta acicola]
MPRSAGFNSTIHKRLLDEAKSQPTPGSVRGPLPFLNPTRARFPLATTAPDTLKAPESTERPATQDAQVEWRARDNRKGRHILVVPHDHKSTDSPRLTRTAPAVLSGIWRMCTVFAWWNISWWIGVLFSVGSAIFVVCGFFYWLPLAAPSTEFSGESVTGGGVTAFIGATLFEVGAVLLIIEAVNENQTGCFGWAVDQAIRDHPDSDAEKQGSTRGHAYRTDCSHHHGRSLHRTAHLQHPAAGRKWEWWPTWHELTHHYFFEIGFLASFTEAVGATVFYVSGIMSLPGIYDKISTPVLYGTYWLAYLVGGILFIVSSVLYMLETQKTWWKPAPSVIGWWIGVWNLIGSIGWTLSAAFGYCTPSWCEYQSDLSLIWASFAFLFGSLLLWYEALDKYPVKRAAKYE